MILIEINDGIPSPTALLPPNLITPIAVYNLSFSQTTKFDINHIFSFHY